MDSRLARLLEEFHGAVLVALDALRNHGIQMPATSMEWTVSQIPSRGQLSDGAHYHKHGYGCAVSIGGVEVDFDFGPTGEVLAPDAWRLVTFCAGRFARFGFENEAQMRRAHSQAELGGELAPVLVPHG